MVKGYCLKEKKKVEIKSPEYEFNTRGTPIVRGKCSSCQGKVYKILGEDDLKDAPADFQKKAKDKKAKKKGGSNKSRRSSKTCGNKSRKSRRSRKSKL